VSVKVKLVQLQGSLPAADPDRRCYPRGLYGRQPKVGCCTVLSARISAKLPAGIARAITEAHDRHPASADPPALDHFL
jgi:hypothetical protein